VREEVVRKEFSDSTLYDFHRLRTDTSVTDHGELLAEAGLSEYTRAKHCELMCNVGTGLTSTACGAHLMDAGPSKNTSGAHQRSGR